MQSLHLNAALALAFIGAGMVAMPAGAVQEDLTGGSGTADSVTIGDPAWHAATTPRRIVPDDSNPEPEGVANRFQFTVNTSPGSAEAIHQARTDGGTGLDKLLAVATGSADASRSAARDAAHDRADRASGPARQAHFSAPAFSQFSRDSRFATHMDVEGNSTSDSLWATMSEDSLIVASVLPTVVALVLFGVGLLGLAGTRTDKRYKRYKRS